MMTNLTQTQDELLHRRLDALVGADRALHTKWLQSYNLDMQRVPQTLMENEEGLQDVLDYLSEEVRADRLLGARR